MSEEAKLEAKSTVCVPLADKVVEAVLSCNHAITRESVVLYFNGNGRNARHELQQRVEIVLAHAEAAHAAKPPEFADYDEAARYWAGRVLSVLKDAKANGAERDAVWLAQVWLAQDAETNTDVTPRWWTKQKETE